MARSGETGSAAERIDLASPYFVRPPCRRSPLREQTVRLLGQDHLARHRNVDWCDSPSILYGGSGRPFAVDEHVNRVLAVAAHAMARSSAMKLARNLAFYLNFLHRRGVLWHEAGFDDWAAFQRHLFAPPGTQGREPIAASTWGGIKWAVKYLYDSAASSTMNLSVSPPYLTRVSSVRVGNSRHRVERIVGMRVPARDASVERGFTPPELASLIAGYESEMSSGSQPRYSSRGIAFAALCSATAMRISTASLMTLYELPVVRCHDGPMVSFTIPGAINKNGRTVHLDVFSRGLAVVRDYIDGSRADLISQVDAPYRPLSDTGRAITPLRVEQGTNAYRVVFRKPGESTLHERRWADVGADLRRRLVDEAGNSVLVFLGNGARPVGPQTHSADFRRAKRAAAQSYPHLDSSSFVVHSFRHTHACVRAVLYMRKWAPLVGPAALYDLSGEAAVEHVKRALGHVSAETTRTYLDTVASLSRFSTHDLIENM